MAKFDARRLARGLACLPVAAGLFLFSGCPGEAPTAVKSGQSGAAAHDHDDGDDDHDHDHDHHDHADQGPHGGALVSIGNVHLELVLDAETGKLTAYVLDNKAEKPVPIKQANLQLGIPRVHKHGDEEGDKRGELPTDLIPLLLAAVDPQDGKASEFSGEEEKLKGAEGFVAVLNSITVGDKSYKSVEFSYPEGNEHH